jgi:hypothetical protein
MDLKASAGDLIDPMGRVSLILLFLIRRRRTVVGECGADAKRARQGRRFYDCQKHT